jgi:hypothetical protein
MTPSIARAKSRMPGHFSEESSALAMASCREQGASFVLKVKLKKGQNHYMIAPKYQIASSHDVILHGPGSFKLKLQLMSNNWALSPSKKMNKTARNSILNDQEMPLFTRGYVMYKNDSLVERLSRRPNSGR